MPTYVAMPILQLVALVRFSRTPSWDGSGAWLYVTFLVSILLLGLFGLRRTWLAGAEALTTPAAAPR